MLKNFDDEVEELRKLILVMGGYVESAIQIAMDSLLETHPENLSMVHDLENKINANHVEVDRQCLDLLARNAPFAKDLRLILAIIKINTDLERMGDQARNIAHCCEDYFDLGYSLSLQHFPLMSQKVRKMVKQALDAFVNGDIDLARIVLESDDEVNQLKRRVIIEYSDYLKTHPDLADSVIEIMSVARQLERLGDHATNIAEDVIFAYSGEDVRHRFSQGGKK